MPPHHLLVRGRSAVGTVRVESRGRETHLTVTIRCASAEHFEQFVRLGVDAGTSKTLDNLVAHLEEAPSLRRRDQLFVFRDSSAFAKWAS